MALVVSGLLNKQIAIDLGISEFTVKAHRGQVMRKMRVDSLVELVRLGRHLTCRSSRTPDTKVSTYTIVQ